MKETSLTDWQSCQFENITLADVILAIFSGYSLIQDSFFIKYALFTNIRALTSFLMKSILKDIGRQLVSPLRPRNRVSSWFVWLAICSSPTAFPLKNSCTILVNRSLDFTTKSSKRWCLVGNPRHGFQKCPSASCNIKVCCQLKLINEYKINLIEHVIECEALFFKQLKVKALKINLRHWTWLIWFDQFDAWKSGFTCLTLFLCFSVHHMDVMHYSWFQL